MIAHPELQSDAWKRRVARHTFFLHQSSLGGCTCKPCRRYMSDHSMVDDDDNNIWSQLFAMRRLNDPGRENVMCDFVGHHSRSMGRCGCNACRQSVLQHPDIILNDQCVLYHLFAEDERLLRRLERENHRPPGALSIYGEWMIDDNAPEHNAAPNNDDDSSSSEEEMWL